MSKRRSQTEIFGLVIIVILLAIGLLFAITVLTKTPPKQQTKESIQAANFLNTIMSTTTQCDKTIRELLQDCATTNKQWQGALICNGKPSCQTIQDITTQILSQTLGAWGKTYEFKISGTEAVEQIKIQNGQCTGEREASTRPEKIRTGLDAQVTLYLC